MRRANAAARAGLDDLGRPTFLLHADGEAARVTLGLVGEHHAGNAAAAAAVALAVGVRLDAVADAGNRWIFPELAERGVEPWPGVRYVAVAGSPEPTHAVDVSGVLDRAVASLEAHKAYLEALDDHPMASAREFLEWTTEAVAPRFGGRPAAAFELFRL